MTLLEKEKYVEYYKTIRHPISFDMILKNINSAGYDTFDDFINDIELLYKNAQLYNREDTQVYQDSLRIEKGLNVMRKTIEECLKTKDYASAIKQLNKKESPKKKKTDTKETPNSSLEDLKIDDDDDIFPVYKNNDLKGERQRGLNLDDDELFSFENNEELKNFTTNLKVNNNSNTINSMGHHNMSRNIMNNSIDDEESYAFDDKIFTQSHTDVSSLLEDHESYYVKKDEKLSQNNIFNFEIKKKK